MQPLPRWLRGQPGKRLNMRRAVYQNLLLALRHPLMALSRGARRLTGRRPGK